MYADECSNSTPRVRTTHVLSTGAPNVLNLPVRQQKCPTTEISASSCGDVEVYRSRPSKSTPRKPTSQLRGLGFDITPPSLEGRAESSVFWIDIDTSAHVRSSLRQIRSIISNKAAVHSIAANNRSTRCAKLYQVGLFWGLYALLSIKTDVQCWRPGNAGVAAFGPSPEHSDRAQAGRCHS
jgi:hypothetical protein